MTAPAAIDGGKNKINSVHGGGSLLEREIDHFLSVAISGALLKIAGGVTAHAVARQGLLKPRDPDTLYGWLRIYEAEGVSGLLAHQHGGQRRGCL